MERDKIFEKFNDFVVIGINKLGESIATHLFALGKEVLAIDKNQVAISGLINKVTTAVAGDVASYDVLYSLGVQNFDCAIICINDNIETSLIASQICNDLGVKYIISVAMSAQHGKILSALGVNMVLYPEEFVGRKLAGLLANPGVNEIVELTDEFKIFEIALPKVWGNKQIQEINIRKKFKLSIVFVKRGNKVLSPEAEVELLEGDTLVVAGESSKINSLSDLIEDSTNVETQITNVFADK